MLSGLILENFKAFGVRQFMPLAPITLIFGPNSAGKSSILQSLLLLKQSADEKGSPPLRFKGDLVDLGDFKQTVFRHDLNRAIEITPMHSPGPFTYLRKELTQSVFTTLPEYSEMFGVGAVVGYDHLQEDMHLVSVPHYLCDWSEPLFWGRTLWNIAPRHLNPDIRPSDFLADELCRIPLANTEHHLLGLMHRRFVERDLEFVRELMDANAIGHGADYAKFWIEEGIDVSSDEIDFQAERERIANYSLSDYLSDKSLRESGVTVRLRRFLLDYDHLMTSGWYNSGREEPFSPTTFERSNVAHVMKRLFTYINERKGGKLYWDFFELSQLMMQASRDFLSSSAYLGPSRAWPDRLQVIEKADLADMGVAGEWLANQLLVSVGAVDRVNAVLEDFRIGYELRIESLSGVASPSDTVFTLRLQDRRNGVRVSLRDVGFGVSQMLPVIAQAALAEGKTLLIEQPELHLHPRLQSSLATLFVEGIERHPENQYIVETHSEHLVLRLQRLVRRKRIDPSQVAILYVERDPTGDETGSWVRHLRLDGDGDFIDEWPGGFFEESFKEIFDL